MAPLKVIGSPSLGPAALSDGGVPEGGWYLSRQIDDFDELALCFPTWDVDFRQLSRGAFQGRLQILQLGGLQILQIQANQVIQARGTQREQRLLYIPVTTRNVGALWKGQQLRAGQLRLLASGEEMDHRTAPDFEVLGMNIVPAAVQNAAGVLHKLDLEAWMTREFAINPISADQARVERYLRHLLQQVEHSPQSVRQPEVAHKLREDCLQVLLESLLGSIPFTLEVEKGHNRRLLAHEVRDFMDLHLREPLLAQDLCREFDVSERTLEYAFREVFGLSPKAYFKVRKLNAVRQALKEADGGSRVVDIVGHWGFWHPGAFAADYRLLFGELPSETLKRRSVRNKG